MEIMDYQRPLTRRTALRMMATGAAALVLTACGGEQADPAARFAQYQPAPEPDGDLSKVVWPDFVTQAGGDVKALYEFQVQNGELMRYMPCFCGCGGDGHRNNRDCYVKAVSSDGSVVFDNMAPT